MVAVISALFDAPDIRAAAREIAQLFNESSRGAHVCTQRSRGAV
jgi:hypothetical protein